MKYDPDKHNRKSIRLKEYDYSKNGYYFITICSKDRSCIFGTLNVSGASKQRLVSGAGKQRLVSGAGKQRPYYITNHSSV